MTFSKLLILSVPQFPLSKMGLMLYQIGISYKLNEMNELISLKAFRTASDTQSMLNVCQIN